MTTPAKLREIDDKLSIVRDSKAKLERLESFLVDLRARTVKAVEGEFGRLVGIPKAEVDGEIRKVEELIRKWT